MAKQSLIACLASAALVIVAPGASAQNQVLGNYQSHRFAPPDPRLIAPAAVPKRIRYGKKHWQDMFLFRASGDAPAPLVIVFYGGVGGWARYRLNEEGYSLAIIPGPQGQMKAQEHFDYTIAAISYLRENAEELGLDMDRIVLWGERGSAHDAMLFGTDPALIERAGVSFSSVRAVVSLAGVGFDIPRRVEHSPVRGARFKRFYGKDLAGQQRFSPVAQLAAPNAPAFLTMAEKIDRDAYSDTQELLQAMNEAGVEAGFVTLPDFRQDSIPTYFMVEENGSGREVLPFLRGQLGDGGKNP